MRRLKPAEKLVKDRLIGEMARESHMIEAMARGYQNSLSITHFTSVLADFMDDDGTVVDRGPHGSGSLVLSLDALK